MSSDDYIGFPSKKHPSLVTLVAHSLQMIVCYGALTLCITFAHRVCPDWSACVEPMLCRCPPIAPLFLLSPCRSPLLPLRAASKPLPCSTARCCRNAVARCLRACNGCWRAQRHSRPLRSSRGCVRLPLASHSPATPLLIIALRFNEHWCSSCFVSTERWIACVMFA